MVKMILADDEPVITRGIRKLVDWQGLGIEIVGEYTDGKSALEGILVKKPDIALLDIYMPQMTGVELLKECQAMEVKTQVILSAGSRTLSMQRRPFSMARWIIFLSRLSVRSCLGLWKSVFLLSAGKSRGRRKL